MRHIVANRKIVSRIAVGVLPLAMFAGVAVASTNPSSPASTVSQAAHGSVLFDSGGGWHPYQFQQQLQQVRQAQAQAAKAQADAQAAAQRLAIARQAAMRAARSAARPQQPAAPTPPPVTNPGPLDEPHSFVCGHAAPSEVAMAYAHQVVASTWDESQWPALYQLWAEESGWNPDNRNCSSGACAIPQFYPCSKLRNSSIRGQVDQGVQYIAGRYGTPDQALEHKHHYGSY